MAEIANQTSLSNAIIRIAVIVGGGTIFVATVVSCFVLYGIFKEQKLAELVRHVEDRARTQQQLFDQVNAINKNAIDTLSERLMYTSVEDSVREFEALFPLQPDGSRRSAPELFEGFVHADGEMIEGIGAFMRADQPLTDQDKHVLVNAYHVVRHIGPVASPQFDNFWFYTPHDQLIIYAPDREDKLLYYRQDAPGTMSFQDRVFAQHGRIDINPDRKLSCTDLSNITYDTSGLTLTSGCLIPFDRNGEFVGAFGTSLLLQGWLDEVIAPSLDYATAILATTDGDIIAHPDLISDDVNRLERAQEIEQELQLSKLASSGKVSDISTVKVSEYAVNGYFVACRKIEGPDWVLLLTVRQEVIFAQVMSMVTKMILIAVVACLIGLVVLRRLLARKISRPLIELREAAINSTSGEELTDPGLVQRTDEVGDLARALADRDQRFQRLVDSLETIVRKRTEQLTQREKKLQQLNQSLQDFSFIVSHDLQAPLRHSEAFVSVLRDEMETSETELTTEAAEALDIIEASCQRMRGMVKSLYELSSLDVRDIKKEPIDLNTVVSEAREQVSTLFAESGASISPETLPYVLGVKPLLVQVFQNLLANTCKYAGETAPHARVYAGKSDDEQLCRIIFEDEGSGIPKPYHEKVFQPFQRLVHSDDVEGAGIGLALCRKILQRHNGDITIDTNYSKGTRFIMTLQRVTGTLAEDASDEPPIDKTAVA